MLVPPLTATTSNFPPSVPPLHALKEILLGVKERPFWGFTVRMIAASSLRSVNFANPVYLNFWSVVCTASCAITCPVELILLLNESSAWSSRSDADIKASVCRVVPCSSHVAVIPASLSVSLVIYGFRLLSESRLSWLMRYTPLPLAAVAWLMGSTSMPFIRTLLLLRLLNWNSSLAIIRQRMRGSATV